MENVQEKEYFIAVESGVIVAISRLLLNHVVPILFEISTTLRTGERAPLSPWLQPCL